MFLHDDWCPCQRGNLSLQFCKCEPHVELGGARYALDASGELTPLPSRAQRRAAARRTRH
jgi:hypothetical protein